MKKLVVLLLLILFIGMIYWWRLPPAVQGPLSDYEFEYIIRISGNGGSSDTLPMIIALHGHGDTPDNFFDTFTTCHPSYMAPAFTMTGLSPVRI